MRLPTNNKVTFPYGATSPPYSPSNPHAGVDFSYSPDPYWYAPERVTVLLVTSGSACGKQVDLLSLDGRRRYRACHNSEIYVKKGQVLEEGQRVAKIGDTGYAFGKHLHFVMWVDGKRVDPLKYLKGRQMTPSSKVNFIYKKLLFRNADKGGLNTYTKLPEIQVWNSIANSAERKRKEAELKAKDQLIAELRKKVAEQQKVLSELNTRPTKAEYEKAIKDLAQTQKSLQDALNKLETTQKELEAEKSEPDWTLQNVVNWIVDKIFRSRK